MDWPAARRLLMGLFLLVDVFLAMQIWGPAPPALPGAWVGLARRDARDARDARERLARFGLYVQGDLPADPPALPLVRLKAAPLDADALARRFFPPAPPQPQAIQTDAAGTLPAATPARARRFAAGGSVLVVEDAGRAVFRQQLAPGATPPGVPPLRPGREPDPQTLREIGGALLAAHGLDINAHQSLPVRADPAGRTTVARWAQRLDDLPLFGTGLAVRVDGDEQGSPRAWQLELAQVRVLSRGEARRLIPGHEALLRLALELSDRGEAGGAVDRVTLGYFARPIPAESWEAPPVWEIELRDGRRFHLNALTGAPEDAADATAATDL